MKRIVYLCIAITALAAAASRQIDARQSPAVPSHGASPQTVLNTYCNTCHNERAKTGGLALDKLDVQHVGENAETWEKVVRKLRSGMMPPSGARRPDRTTLDAFTMSLEAELDRAADAKPARGRASPVEIEESNPYAREKTLDPFH